MGGIDEIPDMLITHSKAFQLSEGKRWEKSNSVNETQGFPIENGKVPTFILILSDRESNYSQYPEEYTFLPSYAKTIEEAWEEVIPNLEEQGIEIDEDDLEDFVVTAFELKTGNVFTK